jgi:hypothetical protein
MQMRDKTVYLSTSKVYSLHILDSEPAGITISLSQCGHQGLLSIPLHVQLAGADVHAPLAAGEHNIGASEVLEEAQLPVADYRDDDEIIFIAWNGT